jgi:anti-anti-sigma factor
VPKPDLAAFRHVDEPDVLAVHLTGEFDVSNAGALRDVLRQASRAGKDVVIDLERVVFMDVVSYELIMSARSAVRASGHALTLVHTPANVQRIIDVVDREIRRHLPPQQPPVQHGLAG